MSSFSRNLLWRRTHDWLEKYNPHLVAIAGSTGKTTTKLAISEALSSHHRVRSMQQPYNNPEGVALGILGIDNDPTPRHWFRLLTNSLVHEIAVDEPDTVVVEIGPERPGDIDWLAQQIKPRLTVLTNVGTANTNLFTNKDMVAHEIASLAVSTPSDSTVLLNTDDNYLADMRSLITARCVTYGSDASSDVRLTRIKRLSHHGFAIEVRVIDTIVELHLQHIIARPQVSAILAALGAAYVSGCSLEQAVAKLQQFRPLPGRLSLTRTPHNALLIDDSYNATPESMMSALATLQALPYLDVADPRKRPVRRIAILGGIENLGGESHHIHQRLGQHVAKMANICITVGQEMRVAGGEALRAGCDVHHFEDAADVGKWLYEYISEHDVILVCGSKQKAMGQIVERLLQTAE